MGSVGKTLILFGIILIIAGILFNLGVKMPWFGRLPGDIHIEKKGFSLFFPITTSIIISIVLSAVFMMIGKK